MLLVSTSYATHERLQIDKGHGETGISFYCAPSIHPNPVLYKHYFYLFTEEASVERDAFFTPERRIRMCDAFKQMDAIRAADDYALGFIERLPRRGDTPFDPEHPRWVDEEWAPPLDEDPDPPVTHGPDSIVERGFR